MSMVIFMKAIGNKIKRQEEECISTSMAPNIKGSGMMIINMVMALRLG